MAEYPAQLEDTKTKPVIPTNPPIPSPQLDRRTVPVRHPRVPYQPALTLLEPMNASTPWCSTALVHEKPARCITTLYLSVITGTDLLKCISISETSSRRRPSRRRWWWTVYLLPPPDLWSDHHVQHSEAKPVWHCFLDPYRWATGP